MPPLLFGSVIDFTLYHWPLSSPLPIANSSLLRKYLAWPVDRLGFLRSGTRDQPDRQRTLQASIAWSYDLLGEDEQALFRRLSVMSGSFSLKAAETVCMRTGMVEIRVIEGIASLIDKSLLKPIESTETEPRFIMLQTIREFGIQRLGDAREEEVARDAHAAHYYDLVQEAEPHLWDSTLAEWVGRLDRELNNLRAALSTYLSREDGAEQSLRLAGSLWRFWEIRGYISEGRTWLDRALQRHAQAPLSSQWLALHGAGNLANVQAEYAVSQKHYQDAMHVLQSLLESTQDADERRHTQRGLAHTFLNLGNIALLLGAGEKARSIHNRPSPFMGRLCTKSGSLSPPTTWRG